MIARPASLQWVARSALRWGPSGEVTRHSDCQFRSFTVCVTLAKHLSSLLQCLLSAWVLALSSTAAATEAISLFCRKP